MPIYEYKCEKCGRVFSILCSLWARHKGAKCPDCGSAQTDRVVSRFSSGSDSGEDSCSSQWPFT